MMYLIAVLFLLMGAGGPTDDPKKDPKDTYTYLQSNFASPPAAYRTAPFWVWNGKESREEIDRQLTDMKARHIGGVFLHPRPGLITPYLSEEWFALVRYAVDRAKALGIELWLYDENSYPSGFAGGNVPAEMPESVSEGQGLQMVRLDSLTNPSSFQFIFRKEGDALVETTAGQEAGKKGDYYAFRLINYPKRGWNGGYSYVDLLKPGVTEKFIEVTMRGYEKVLGADLGTTVPGIFTDEPNINPPSGPGQGAVRSTARYTPDLFQAFQARWGYDLKPNLVSLFEEVGDWRRIRHNYQALLLDLFIDRWSKPWYAYTEQKKLQWTGHYWEHGWPGTADGPDNMAMYAWHQMPGIDMLFNSESTRPDQFGNVRAVKELSSVANQLGRRRTLSETYGGSGWELRFEDMKRLGDWEYVLGVNFMNQHLTHSTLKGARKRDYPQSFSYHTPWWEQYDVLADYFGRLSLALSSGQQVNTTLVIEPTTTAWMYNAPGRSAPRLKEIGNDFASFLDDMEALQVEYDLGSERIFQDHARVEGSRFVVGQCAYDLVVLPPGYENIDRKTANLLELYLRQGGRVLSFVDPPRRVDGVEMDRFDELSRRYATQWIRAAEPTEALNVLTAKDFQVYDPERFGGRLFHHRRRLDRGQLLFLTNYGINGPISGRLTIAGAAVDRLDPLTGEVSRYPVRRDGKRVSLGFEIPSAGSLLLFVHDSGQPLLENGASKSREEVVSGSEMIVHRAQPNVLTLDYLDYRTGEKSGDGVYYLNAADSVYRAHGFTPYGIGYNPWNGAVQFRSQLIDRDMFGEGTGFEATYRFIVGDGFTASREALRLAIEWPHLYKVYVNDREVIPIPNTWWLDRSFGVFEVGHAVVPGENRVTIKAAPFSIFAEIEPVYILGEFGLESREKGFAIIPPKALRTGAWNKQGLPTFGHSVSYKRFFEAGNGKQASYKIRLGKWAGTVAEVRVNGEKAGIIGWKPYELDVTKHIRSGRNEVEVIVYGSLKNTLGPHHGRQTPGFVSPWSYAGPAVQPAGNAYQVLEYGLFEDFSLVRMNGSVRTAGRR